MSLNLYHVETSYGLCVQNTHCVSGALFEKSYAGSLVVVGAAVGPLQWQHTGVSIPNEDAHLRTPSERLVRHEKTSVVIRTV